jgi:hypothetical protein
MGHLNGFRMMYLFSCITHYIMISGGPQSQLSQLVLQMESEANSIYLQSINITFGKNNVSVIYVQNVIRNKSVRVPLCWINDIKSHLSSKCAGG